jgi:hypothetical protein
VAKQRQREGGTIMVVCNPRLRGARMRRGKFITLLGGAAASRSRRTDNRGEES